MGAPLSSKVGRKHALRQSGRMRRPMRETVKTVCNRDCPDACSLVAHVEDGRVVQLGGDPSHPVTQGFLCWRTNNFLPLQYSPERLTTPLLRGKPVAWDEALDYAAKERLRIRAESGQAAIFHCGKNPVVSSPHLVPVLDDAGASKLLIDPVWHKSARFCDAFVQPRPGGDFSLAMAVARLLFERGWTEAGFEKYCDNVPEFRSLAFAHTVAGWCEDADVSPSAAEDVARRLH